MEEKDSRQDHAGQRRTKAVASRTGSRRRRRRRGRGQESGALSVSNPSHKEHEPSHTDHTALSTADSDDCAQQSLVPIEQTSSTAETSDQTKDVMFPTAVDKKGVKATELSPNIGPKDLGDDGVVIAETTSPTEAPHQEALPWLMKALHVLGHPLPLQFQQAHHVYSVAADKQLQELTLWLEDRHVKRWDLERVTLLRQNFWLQLTDYLSDVNCPPIYYQSLPAAGNEGHTCLWRNRPEQRQRVLFWLCSCAVSQAHQLHRLSNPQVEALASTTTSTAAPRIQEKTPPPDLLIDISCFVNRKDLDVDNMDWDSFPLGFTTGDVIVDRLLTIFRMELLLGLEREQLAIQERILHLQNASFQDQGSHNKPLIQHKPRKRR